MELQSRGFHDRNIGHFYCNQKLWFEFLVNWQTEWHCLEFPEKRQTCEGYPNGWNFLPRNSVPFQSFIFQNFQYLNG